jgi:hypothetical protein
LAAARACKPRRLTMGTTRLTTASPVMIGRQQSAINHQTRV